MIFKKKTIHVPKIEAERLTRLLNTEPTRDSCMTEEETIVFTANFGNGIERDVKVCGVEYLYGESNLPWTEAVLFKDGSEISHTDPQEDLFGEWEFEIGNDKYVVEIATEL